MSWQEDLRQLDADLAAGRIEPAAHRKQRDELLAAASGMTVPSPVAAPLRRPDQSWHSANPAMPGTPPQENLPTQASPAQQVPVRPYRPPSRTTPHSAAPHKSLATSGVPALPDHLSTAPSPADINPTRYVAVKGPLPNQTTRPSRFPPVRPHLAPSPADTKHTEPLHRRENQPEAAQPPGNRRLPTWLFLAAGVLLVLTLIAGGTWWLGSGKSSESAPPGLSTTTLPSEPPAQALEPQLEDKVPQLPGTQFPQNSTLSLSKALELNLFAKETGQVFAQHGATRVVFRGSTAGDIGYLAFAVPTESDSDAKAVVDYLRDATRSGGFAPITGDPEVVTGRTGERRTDGTWYASGKVAVVLWASQQFDLEKAQLKDALDNTLASFRKALPPS